MPMEDVKIQLGGDKKKKKKKDGNLIRQMFKTPSEKMLRKSGKFSSLHKPLFLW